MQTPNTCLCGAVLRAAAGAEPFFCPTCGIPNTFSVPVAGLLADAGADAAEPRRPSLALATRPAPAKRAETIELPSWIMAPILGSLAMISGVIVLVGWWLVQPVSETVHLAEVRAEEKTPPITAPPMPAQPQPESAPVAEPIAEVQPSQSFVLPRRMPSPVETAPEPLVVTPIKNVVAPAPPVEEKAPSIIWALEKPAPGLIPMVEVSKRASADLAYSVRRLKLPADAAKPLRLAVTPTGHDDIGSVLTRMGDGYRYRNLRNQDLFSFQTMREHDVIFLTCADLYAQDFQAVVPLRKFVEQGGTLYASDLRGDMVLAAFPEFRAAAPLLPGLPQRVDASVVEPGLQAYVNRKTVSLQFDAPGWRPAAFDPQKVTVCLAGAYRDSKGHMSAAPLLVKFRVRQGTVIFTSFHHAKNDSVIVGKLLDYLVFTSVSARSEARVREFMQRYNFAPRDLHPAVLTANQDVEAAYQHPGGGLQIAVGFENQGAKLKLTLRSPTGQTIEHEDQGIFLIEVPQAAAGQWHYTITPLALPHENFPCVIAVGRRPE